MTITLDLAREGFRRASTPGERAAEAGELVNRAARGNPRDIALLHEALTTSDFTNLLGKGLDAKAITAFEATPKEFEGILAETDPVPDFERRRLVDIWGGGRFGRVHEGEEYKGTTLKYLDMEHGVGKFGETLKISWELVLARRFWEIQQFPQQIADGAVQTQNGEVTDLLVKGGSWNTSFFGDVKTVPLNADTLRAAIQEIATRKNHRGKLVDTSDLYLVHGPALKFQVADLLVNLSELEITDQSGTKTTKQRITNPFRGLVKPLESLSLGDALSVDQAASWALIPGKRSNLPAVLLTKLQGHPDVDIRMENAQGQAVSGATLSPFDGSFKDDTIAYRGRSVLGIDKGFTTGVWASKGA